MEANVANWRTFGINKDLTLHHLAKILRRSMDTKPIKNSINALFQLLYIKKFEHLFVAYEEPK